MSSSKRKLPFSSWISALRVCCLTGSAALLIVPAYSESPQAVTASAPEPEYLAPQRLPAAEMTPQDQALLRSKEKEIASEAAFFGYDLSQGKWSYDQLICRQLPGDLLLHYRSTSRTGAVSLFTAVVPRGEGRVQVVPVLYRNATPFHSAVGSERTMAVFNRMVPAEAAAKAIQPDGPWLELGICYAELAGAEPRVPQKAAQDPALVKAPLPSLHISEGAPGNEIVFTDRDAPGGYLVWNIFMNGKGRVTAAATKSLSDYVGRNPSEREPKERILPEGSEPQVKPMPEGQQQPAKPR